MPASSISPPILGVVIISFNSSDVIRDCLESLLAARNVSLYVVVVDNASEDDTPRALSDWASGREPWTPPDDLPFALEPAPKPLALVAPGDSPPPPLPALTLINATANGGFAAGVNLGLAELNRHPEIDRFWILNPDSLVPPDTPRAFATHPAPQNGFALMGGRVSYLDPPDMIQSDGGTIDWRTGVTNNLNLGQSLACTNPPAESTLDFIPGSSMVATRAFYAAEGPMSEEYFLYYEEVDWAMRRGNMPLLLCPDAHIYHRAGTAIGSATLARLASPFSLYFLHRARIRFIRLHYPRALLGALAFSLGKAGQLVLKGHIAGAAAVLAASFGLRAPAAVRSFFVTVPHCLKEERRSDPADIQGRG